MSVPTEEVIQHLDFMPEPAIERLLIEADADHLDFIPDDPAELRRAVTRMAAQINLADWHFIKLIAAMERTRGWREGGYCNLGNWLDHRWGIDEEDARKIACDADLTEFIQDARGNLLNYERRRRIVPARLMQALKLRDHNRCRFPGCAHQRYVEAHHVRHWIDGGETCLENLVTLCSAHHRLLHHGAFHITIADDDAVFITRDGEVIEPALRPQFADVSAEVPLLGPDTIGRRLATRPRSTC